MTNEEINDLVAEYFFNWTRKDGVLMPLNFFSNPGEAPRVFRVPDYCDDIGKAWGVVEAMRAKFKFSLSNHDRFGYVAEFGLWSGTGGAYATCESPGKAICLAALKAIGLVK